MSTGSWMTTYRSLSLGYKQSTVGLGVYWGLAFIFTPSIQRWQITIHTSYKLTVLIFFFKVMKTLHFSQKVRKRLLNSEPVIE